MVDIFISYRRRDNAHAAGRLYDQLANVLGARKLFMDVDSIPPGADFVAVLESHVSKCKVLLAVIGPGWTLAKDERGQLRLWNPHDFVRIEITAALVRGIPVVPILIDGATLPLPKQLPDQLLPLLRKNALCIAHETFASDVLNLVQGLRPALSSTFGLANLFQFFGSRAAMPSDAKIGWSALNPPANLSGILQGNGLPVLSLVEEFYRERILIVTGGSVSATQLYEAFCDWCDSMNCDPIALPTFARETSELGIRKQKIAGRVRYIGIGLRHF